MNWTLLLLLACVNTAGQALADEYGDPKAIHERVDECLDEIKPFCSMPHWGPSPRWCLEGFYENMFDPGTHANDLRETLTGPNGNLWLYATGAFWANPPEPPPSVYQPILACLLNGKPGKCHHKGNPCDRPPDVSVTAKYDPDINYCTYSLTDHSPYQVLCQLYGNEVVMFPEHSGGWSLPGQCSPNPSLTCKPYPTNSNGYSFNNAICRVPKDECTNQDDDKHRKNPCDEPPKYSLTYNYDKDTHYCTYQLANQSAYQMRCQLAGNELSINPNANGGRSLPGQCNPTAPVVCTPTPTNSAGYSYNNKICVDQSAHQMSVADNPASSPAHTNMDDACAHAKTVARNNAAAMARTKEISIVSQECRNCRTLDTRGTAQEGMTVWVCTAYVEWEKK